MPLVACWRLAANDMTASMPSSTVPMWHFCLQKLTCTAIVLNIKRLPAQTILRTVTRCENLFCRCNRLLYMTGKRSALKLAVRGHIQCI